MSDKNISHNEKYILYTKPNTLPKNIFKSLSHMPIKKKCQTPFKAVRDQNKFKLQTHVQIEHGPESYAQITERTPVYFMCYR